MLRSRYGPPGGGKSLMAEAVAAEVGCNFICVVSQNGWLLGRRGRSLPANASGLDTHRDSISSRFDCR
jgi:hypothetical protein